MISDHSQCLIAMRLWRVPVNHDTFSCPVWCNVRGMHCNKADMVIPATNAVKKRSASALHRVKTYLWSTMSKLWLTNLLLLHTHKQRNDALDIPFRLNACVQDSDHRQQIFSKFKSIMAVIA